MLLFSLLVTSGCSRDGADEAFEPAPWAVRRLTRDQLRYTLVDLLGVDVTPRIGDLPPEVRAEGFTNTDVALVATADHVEGWAKLAPWVAEQWDVATWLGASACQDVADPCVRESTERLLELLLRRPVASDEVDRYDGLWTVAVTEGLDVEDGLRLVVEAALQSPGFLYHVEDETFEADGTRRVSGPALANRLSYLVWQSAPDRALSQIAVAGGLDTVEGRLAQLDRLLLDVDRARRSTDRFARDWLALDGLLGLERDDADVELTATLHEAAVRSWHHHLWTRQHSVYDVLDAGEVAVHPSLAAWYGVEPSSEWSVIPTAGLSTPRSGLLTWPGVLASTADRDVGGIVARGLFIRDHFLCRTELHPPEDLNLSEFRNHLGPDATEREYSDDRLAQAECAGCHAQFDPFAFGLVPFDGLGRHDPMARSDGWVPSADGELDYDDAEGLGAILAMSSEVRRCLTRKHVQFALGRPLEVADEAAIASVDEAAQQAGGTWADVLRAVVAHPIFVVVAQEAP
ncbi:MAG: DUF1592 domain-containing protein [Myxococcota bacterium]